jgi:uncharacterized protein
MQKIILFIIIAYAWSWSVSWIIQLLNIKYGSITSYVGIALLYMTGPAIAAIIVQKFIYKTNIAGYGFPWPGFSWQYILLTFGLIWAIMIGTVLIIGLLGNVLQMEGFGQVDFSKENLVEQTQLFMKNRLPALANNPVQPPPFPPIILLILILVQGAVVGGLLNFPFALGEEYGWRGFLQNETVGFGFIKSSLLIGLVWGIWHAPLILQGHNYPGYTWAGVGMMIAFSLSLSFLLTYLQLRTRSVVYPTLFHGALNAVGPAIPFFIARANPLFGTVAGVAGILAILIVTAVVLIADNAFFRKYTSI